MKNVKINLFHDFDKKTHPLFAAVYIDYWQKLLWTTTQVCDVTRYLTTE